ncbi:MAG: Dam family site-specific DNA-(adenine-N6)-methyltransferase [Acidimicrobiaceae bacterium]|nr:Dam family site-specific DNA-(adenine-N6)-methyltransferase [Acidimicrobiaceae bacterium]
MQLELIQSKTMNPDPFKTQLLKWVGNKQRFGHEIASYFPATYNTYYEPFLGSGGVLSVVRPHAALGSDGFKPLAEIWMTLSSNPERLIGWYQDRYELFQNNTDRVEAYARIKEAYNSTPNPGDLLFLSRSCYGGIIRFRLDGYMSTPIGVHEPISPDSFEKRVKIWSDRTKGARFAHMDFREAIEQAGEGDVVYCDPPYVDTQAILYGAQRFSLSELFSAIDRAKERGAKVALSIDGTKKTGRKHVSI